VPSRIDSWKLAELHKNWECAQSTQENFRFYNADLSLCTTTEGREQTGTPEQRYGRGPVKGLMAMETYENQKIVTDQPTFFSAHQQCW